MSKINVNKKITVLLLTSFLFLVLLLWLLLSPSKVQAVTFTVDTVADSNDSTPGDGLCQDGSSNCSLRAAAEEANALAGDDTIDLPAGTYTLTIALGGRLLIDSNIDLVGATATTSIVEMEAGASGLTGRVMQLGDFASSTAYTINISDITVRNGNTSGTGGGMLIAYSCCTGTVVNINNIIFTGNNASVGGALHNSTGGTTTITNAVFDNNTATSVGGGIANDGTLTLFNATISNNFADYSGGIENDAEIYLTNVTISNNQATFNGGGYTIQSTPSATGTLTNVTIANNSAGDAGGGFQDYGSDGLVFRNVILNNNTATTTPSEGNCSSFDGNFPNITSTGNNLSSDSSCTFFTDPGDIINTDAMLDALADNGGFSQTHALQLGSPARDSANGATCPGTDQRGSTRPTDGDGNGIADCDIGSFEAAQIPVTPTVTPTLGPTTVGSTATPTPTPTSGQSFNGITTLPATGSFDLQTLMILKTLSGIILIIWGIFIRSQARTYTDKYLWQRLKNLVMFKKN